MEEVLKIFNLAIVGGGGAAFAVAAKANELGICAELLILCRYR